MDDLHLIKHYLFIKQCRLEDDYQVYLNHIKWSQAEPYNYLDLIIFQARLALIKEINAEYRILLGR